MPESELKQRYGFDTKEQKDNGKYEWTGMLASHLFHMPFRRMVWFRYVDGCNCDRKPEIEVLFSRTISSSAARS